MPTLGSGNDTISRHVGTEITVSGLPIVPELQTVIVQDAEFGSLHGPEACHETYELSVRATLDLEGQQVFGWLWWILDEDGEVLPSRLSMPAGEAADSWARTAGILDDGVLGIEVEGEDVRLFRAASFDDALLTFDGYEALPNLPTGMATWTGP